MVQISEDLDESYKTANDKAKKTIKNTANRKTGTAEPTTTAKELQTSKAEPSRTAFFIPKGMAIR